MADWLSYSLQDFLLFSPRVYWRFIADYFVQQTIVAVIILIISVLLVSWRRYLVINLCIFIALGWLYLGWSFYLQHYAQINPMVSYLAYACFVQALIMLVFCLVQPKYLLESTRLIVGYIIIAGISIAPALCFMFFEHWQAGVVGIHPITTSVFTLGLLSLRKKLLWPGLSLFPFLLLIIEIMTLNLVLND